MSKLFPEIKVPAPSNPVRFTPAGPVRQGELFEQWQKLGLSSLFDAEAPNHKESDNDAAK